MVMATTTAPLSRLATACCPERPFISWRACNRRRLESTKAARAEGKGAVCSSDHGRAAELDARQKLDRPVLSRRAHLATLSAALSVFLPQAAANAEASKMIRLKDVVDVKLQEALRMAVAGDLEVAEQLFSELIEVAPESASAWSNRGSVRISLEKFEAARSDLTRAIELAPEAAVPFLNRAIANESLGKLNEAIADCDAAIRNDPQEFAAWFNKANVELRLEDYNSALEDYKEAARLAPGVAGYRFREALVLFQLGRPREAEKLMAGLVRKYPNYAEARAALAAVLWSEGEQAQAEGQFSSATAEEPRLENLKWIEANLQWPPDMVKAMKRFLALSA